MGRTKKIQPHQVGSQKVGPIAINPTVRERGGVRSRMKRPHTSSNEKGIVRLNKNEGGGGRYMFAQTDSGKGADVCGIGTT